MSRTSQLPPRFPHHPRIAATTHNVADLDLDLELHKCNAPQQHGDASDDPPPPPPPPPSDEQCQWVDDLVGGRDDASKPILAPLRRCVSDPVPILAEGFNFDFSSIAIDDDYDDEILKPLGTELHRSLLDDIKFEGGSGLACGPISLLPTLKESGGSDPPPSLVVPNPQILGEEKGCCSSPAEKEQVRSGSVYGPNSPRSMERRSGSFYGPNSPRHMEDLTKSESSLVSAILENANSRNPFSSYLVALDHPVGGANESGVKVKVDAGVTAASESRDSKKALRRNAGQRSRILKVQYIAELERTVNFYQALVADLAARVGMLYQQRAVLSIENNTLRQDIANLRKNKMIKEGQHHFLKNELKKLKATSGYHRKSKSSCFVMDAFRPDASNVYWGMLDVGKPSLGGSPTPLRQGFKS